MKKSFVACKNRIPLRLLPTERFLYSRDIDDAEWFQVADGGFLKLFMLCIRNDNARAKLVFLRKLLHGRFNVSGCGRGIRPARVQNWISKGHSGHSLLEPGAAATCPRRFNWYQLINGVTEIP